MNKERFNKLLGDLNQVTNEDIKSLNELRKKYPFFQTPYVIVAKALKDRDHPKTDAFIKKAAIYSPNRSYLKKIIMGEISFKEEEEVAPEATIKAEVKPEVVKEVPPPSVVAEVPATAEVSEAVEVSKEAPVAETEVKAEPVEKPTQAPPSLSKPEMQIEATIDEKEIPSEEELSEQSKEISQLEKDLAEIRARKQKLARMLEGQEVEAKVKAEAAKDPNKSQVELIEKFIKNEPRFENKKGDLDGKEYVQEDLAAKHLKHKDEFITETLAKLLTKQQKYNRAVDIYEKLSLKFPEKRTYFASQIQKIKEVKNV